MGFEPKPHGDFYDDEPSSSPLLLFIITVIGIFSFWYEENVPRIKDVMDKELENCWPKTRLSKRERFIIIIKCLISDIKNHRCLSIVIFIWFIYLLIRCFL